MKEGTIFGIAIGMAAGIVLMEACKPAKDLVEKGKKKVKEQVAKM